MSDERYGLEQLTWDVLSVWEGSGVLSRGKSYKSQVRDLRMAANGSVLA
jgi:hypothetical protein